MKNLKSITFLIVTFCLIFYSCDTNNNLEPFLSNSKVVDSIVGSYVDNGSQALLLVRVEGSDGNVKYEYSKKNNKLVPDYKINKDTWFRIWSMSKIVTISLTLDLVEDGLLKLEDPVSKYIPELRDLKIALSNNGQPLTDYGQALGNDKSEIKDPCPIKLVESDSEMTVLQLINHEAGFYYSTTGIECLDNDLASKNLAASKNSNELIQKLSELPLIDHPGNKHFYGLNTTVLGLVNERVSGESLDNLVKNRITNPMNIKGLQYNKNDDTNLLPVFSGADSTIRLANNGELDIMGQYVPGYGLENELFMGGEGMIGTADGYADFLRMLLNHGELNGYRFLNESSVKELYAPHTQLDNEYGYNGYNLWVTSKLHKEKGYGDEGLWTGGGYEGTHFWIDPKRDFVGLIMTQMFETPKAGHARDNSIRGEIYKQIFKKEN
ncbi:MAG: serine hydrolase domain-containing protein [Flavobacteriales bacterium]|jgi:CubicO group peptidase (beta-lactamase class C family)|tara:strand:+ start:7161 stop:8471 length:1311 start_codon:yes stop_codon:yes gene_type:complete